MSYKTWNSIISDNSVFGDRFVGEEGVFPLFPILSALSKKTLLKATNLAQACLGLSGRAGSDEEIGFDLRKKADLDD